MPLQKQFVEVPLSGGLDTQQSTELQSPGSLTEAANLRFNQLGQLEKRPASFAAMFFGPASEPLQATFEGPSGPMVLSEEHGVLEVKDQTTLVGLFPEGREQQPRAARVGRFYATSTQESAGSLGISSPTCAALNGFMAIAWEETSNSSTIGTIFRVVEIATKRVVATGRFAVTGAGVVAVPESKRFVVVGTGAGSFIKAVYWDTTTQVFGSLTTIESSSTRVLAVQASAAAPGATGSFFVAFLNASSGNQLRVRKYAGLGFGVLATHDGAYAPAYASLASDAGTDCMITAVVGAGSRVVYVEAFGSPGPTTVYSDPGTVLNVTHDINNVGSVLNTANNALYVAVTVVATAPGGASSVGIANAYFVHFVTVSLSPITAVNAIHVDHVTVASDGVMAGGGPLFPVQVAGDFTDHLSTGLLIRPRVNDVGANSRFDVIAKYGHDRVCFADLPVVSADLVKVGSKIYVPLPCDPSKIFVPAAIHTTMAQGVMVSEVELAEGSAAMPVHAARDQGASIVSSGYVFDVDGLTVVETQPHAPPTLHVQYGTAGSTTTAGSVGMVALYSFVDNQGRMHRSAPSVPVVVPPVTSKELIARVCYPAATSLSPDNSWRSYSCELYVTEDGGSTYHLAMKSGAKHIPDPIGRPFWRFDDVQPSDGSPPGIYSSGDAREELASESPPAFAGLVQIGDRFFGLDAEDRSRIWPSKPIVAGYAVEWNTACTLRISDDGVGVSDVNGTPAVFGRKGVWVIDGDGPNALNNGSFAPARRLPVDVECVSATSICKTPVGIVFRTRRGISLLGLDMSVSPIGLPVDKLMPYSETSTVKCLYDDRQKEVRVIDSANGVFIYHVIEQKWTRWINGSPTKMVDACVSGGRVYFLNTDDSEWSLRREAGLDEADHNWSSMPWALSTPWIRLDNVSGFGRLWRLMVSLRLPSAAASPTTAMVVTVTADFDDLNVIAAQTWSGTDLQDGPAEVLRWFALKPYIQRVTAIKVSIQVVGSESFGGESPVSLKFEMGLQPGGVRQLPPSKYKG